ncbi:MAG: OprO/OprP family phosphate-selective porin, partial [Planctomycetes bacterium]|nr:OprO/OprP family phosphate-selective porin [Planctomycetota bacterium]
FASQSDIEFHESPALDLGFHYAFNDDQYDALTTRIPFPLPRQALGVGAFGLTNTNGLQINQFGFDTAFKYMGFSATGEYILRMVDPRRAGRQPFSNWWLMTRQADTTVQHGAYVQLGYFLPIPGLEKKLEAVARVGGISALANGRDAAWEYAAGLNYYLEGQNVKLQADVTKVDEVPITSSYKSLANVNDDALMFRVQLQVAF